MHVCHGQTSIRCGMRKQTSGQTEVVRISDTENATMLHTGCIINKNMKKGYPLRENLEPSGDHISRNNDNLYLM